MSACHTIWFDYSVNGLNAVAGKTMVSSIKTIHSAFAAILYLPMRISMSHY